MEARNDAKVIQSTCGLCNSGCGVLIHVQNGNPIKIEGDPEHPVNKGFLCSKGQSSLEHLQHPERLKHPLKRIGRRGEGKWQPISWNEALETISSELIKVRQKYGLDSIAFLQGCAKGYSDSYLSRFANVFGSVNIASMSSVCFHARLRGMLHTYGFMSHVDYQYPPGCTVMWGANPASTDLPEGQQVFEACRRGSKLIVIDPAETILAQKADIWVKPRPSSDLALALGMINVIIGANLYDQEFVKKWTIGFDKLQDHVQGYTPERVAKITWVPSETLIEVSRLYALNKPAGICCGNGQDNNINNFQFNRAAAILRAITGNIGIPGGDVDWIQPRVEPGGSPELHQRNAIPVARREQRVGAEESHLPTYFSALPQKLIKAMLTSKPYPIRAAYIQGGSLLHTYSNVREVYQALNSLDFLAVADLFLTPTAELGDIVLPVASYLENDGIRSAKSMPACSIVQKVTQIGSCWSDAKILGELGRRLGLGQHFWSSENELLDFILRPSGLTFEEFRRLGLIKGKTVYHSYETSGFKTPSGKVELYSNQLKEWGFDPLPVYQEPPESPFSAPELSKEYPLIMTSSKLSGYIHSCGRQIESLRQSHPEPIVTINIETAAKAAIKEGDWVNIETKRGRIRQRAALSPSIDPRVIILEHGWWFPEKSADIHGWAESNINILTDNNPPYGRELGTVTLRGILCKVYK